MDSNYHDLLLEFDLSFLVVTTSKLEGKSSFAISKPQSGLKENPSWYVLMFLQSIDY